MLIMSEEQFAQVSSHATEAYPHECCGILLGRTEESVRSVNRVVRCDNTHAEAETNYAIDPRALINAQKAAREDGQEIVGFYHSHPDHPPNWSRTDLEEAHWDQCSYLIVSVDHRVVSASRCFLLQASEDEKRFIEEAFCVGSPSEVCLEAS